MSGRSGKPDGAGLIAVERGPHNGCGWAGVFPIVDARGDLKSCPLCFSLGTGDRLGTVFRDAGLTDLAD